MNDAQKRGWRTRIAEHWTPLFPEETEITALTAEEFAEACDWPALRAAGIVGEHEEPLGVAGLRLSAIFPRHLLRLRDDGRLVPISCEDAAALVRIALAQAGRATLHAVTTRPVTAVRITDVGAASPCPNVATDRGTDTNDAALAADGNSNDANPTEAAEVGDPSPGTDAATRRRFPFRRRD